MHRMVVYKFWLQIQVLFYHHRWVGRQRMRFKVMKVNFSAGGKRKKSQNCLRFLKSDKTLACESDNSEIFDSISAYFGFSIVSTVDSAVEAVSPDATLAHDLLSKFDSLLL